MSGLKDIERAMQYHKQQLGFERGRGCSRLAERYELAIEALEKQMPKKPKLMDATLVGARFWWYCGHCGASRHTGSRSNYCSYCGGKVDWEV